MHERVYRGQQATSPFHAYLEKLFNCHIDVQWTTGRLNYINGHTAKAQDAMDFGWTTLQRVTAHMLGG